MMPDGLLEALTLEQALDLIAYLMHHSQAPTSMRKHPISQALP